jgi:glutathione S-transferase
MKLYFAPNTRAVRARWLLEELGVPYELVRLDLSQRQHKTPEYKQIHPHGVVPSLVDGDLTLIESAAICLYLADKFPDKHFAPTFGSPERGRYYQWVVYAMATVDPVSNQLNAHTRALPEDKRDPKLAEEVRQKLDESAAYIARELKGPWLLGERFTAADVVLGALVVWAGALGALASHPSLQEYAKRCAARPAFARSRA